MVEVGDSIGRTETDLTELRKSRKKDSAATPQAPAVPRPAVRPVNGTAPLRTNGQQKHRSLGALLGTPKGPLGKATFPQKSPFENRHASSGAENDEWEEGRPPKRQRMATAPEWNMAKTAKATNPHQQPETPLWARKVDAVKKQQDVATKHGQEPAGTTDFITLSDDDEDVTNLRDDFLPGFSDDALAPSSPVKDKRVDACKVAGRSSSPAFQTQQAPQPARPLKDGKTQSPPAEKPGQNPAKTRPTPSHRDDGLVKELARGKKPALDATCEDTTSVSESSKPASSKSGQTLRLAASAPRKKSMLICQSQVSKRAKNVSPTDTDLRPHQSLDIPSKAPKESRPKSAIRQSLEARLARIDKKGGSTSLARFSSVHSKSPPIEDGCDDGFTKVMSNGNDLDEGDDGGGPQQSTHEISAMELRRLDDMMLPPAAPPAPGPPRKAPSPPKATSPAKDLPSSRREDRPLQRVAPESMAAELPRPKRVPGAPVRYTPTPSPTKHSRQTTSVPAVGSREATPTIATNEPSAPSKTTYKPKKPLQKSVSLNVTSNGTSTVILGKPFQAPGKAGKTKEPEKPKDLGPWSREAFDLFTWRPPNWDEEKWCIVKEATPSRVAGSGPPAGLSGGTALPRV